MLPLQHIFIYAGFRTFYYRRSYRFCEKIRGSGPSHYRVTVAGFTHGFKRPYQQAFSEAD